MQCLFFVAYPKIKGYTYEYRIVSGGRTLAAQGKEQFVAPTKIKLKQLAYCIFDDLIFCLNSAFPVTLVKIVLPFYKDTKQTSFWMPTLFRR